MPKHDFSNALTGTVRVRVPFFDMDPAGVAWHGRYFQYFELARCDLLESVDYGYEAMMRSGILWPVADANVRYVRPLMLNQDVTVTAALMEWEMRIVVAYRIEGDDGTVYTRARTVQVPVDADSHELVLGSPQSFVAAVEEKRRDAGLTAQ